MRATACLALVCALAGSGPVGALGVMRLTSAVIGADARIPQAQSNFGANRSPPLAWTPVAGARSYAIVLDDPDASHPRPFLHWLIWNIPGTVTSLPQNLPATARLSEPPGAVQGRNDNAEVGYFGPRPPSGLHHYHFQVFALDTLLRVDPGANRAALSAAMNGHLLAVGEMVATFPAPGAG